MPDSPDIRIAQAIEIEKVLLGAMLVDPSIIPIVSAGLELGDWYGPLHRRVYQRILELQAFSMPIGVVQVYDYCEDKEMPFDFFADLAEKAMPGSVEYSVRKIKDYSKRRTAQKALMESIEQMGANPLTDLGEQYANLSQTFTQLLQEEKTLITVREQIIQTLKKIESHNEADFMKIGFPSIDRIIGGMCKGELWIVAGRSSMGKSAFAANCCLNMARANVSVAYISVEGTNHSLMCRMLSMYSGVPLRLIRTGALEGPEVNQVAHAANVISDLEMFRIADKESRWPKIKANIQQLKIREPNLGAAFVDYLGLVDAYDKPSRSIGERQSEVAYMSADAKRLAVSLNIGMVFLNQLNRDVEKRKDHRPMLSDLRESGALEQNADVVLMLYRPAYYGEKNRHGVIDNTVAEVAISKNREGAVGVVDLHFKADCVRFSERIS